MDDEEPPRDPEIVAAEREVGEFAEVIADAADPAGETLASQKQMVVPMIKNRVGTKKVRASELSFAPSWILEEATKTELEENWKDAYDLVSFENLRPNANVIASHVVSKVKEAQGGALRL